MFRVFAPTIKFSFDSVSENYGRSLSEFACSRSVLQGSMRFRTFSAVYTIASCRKLLQSIHMLLNANIVCNLAVSLARPQHGRFVNPSLLLMTRNGRSTLAKIQSLTFSAEARSAPEDASRINTRPLLSGIITICQVT
jgi:hypothetical protein